MPGSTFGISLRMTSVSRHEVGREQTGVKGVHVQVVVTGGAGFVGSHLTEACIARGWTVTAIDCFTDYYSRAIKRTNIEQVSGEERFRLVEADLSVDPIEPLLDGVDVVFHLAAQPGVRASWGTTFDAYTSANVVALQRLLEAVKDRSLQKFVFASSSSVYGDAERLPTPESTALSPASPYGATKVLGEHLCSLYLRSYAVPIVALRYFSVYGPRQRPDMAFSKLIDSALRGTEMLLYGDGSQTRDFTYIADVVAATIAAAELASPGAVYNVGGGSRMPLTAAIDLITAEVGDPPRLRRAQRQRGDARDTAADTSRIARELEFVPSWDVVGGLPEQIHGRSARPAYSPSLLGRGISRSAAAGGRCAYEPDAILSTQAAIAVPFFIMAAHIGCGAYTSRVSRGFSSSRSVDGSSIRCPMPSSSSGAAPWADAARSVPGVSCDPSDVRIDRHSI